MRLSRVICLLAALVGCESDAKRFERLESEQTAQCLLEQADRGKLDMARPNGNGPLTSHVDSLERQWMNHRTSCELATRDMNKFMGR